MVPPDGVLNVKSITCNSIPGLVSKQHRYCSHNIELMPSIARGIKLGIDQCKYQLKNRRFVYLFHVFLDRGHLLFYCVGATPF